ncbi:MAG: G1 family endopeptidase, partial [Firmicutes bacterium]|nr:G1 family endopeptidase [Bacillota bacterium]
PMTATNQALIAHGYPVKPTSVAAQAAWKQAVERIKKVMKVPAVKTTGQYITLPWVGNQSTTASSSGEIGVQSSSNWSGYEDVDSDRYHLVTAKWVVPNVTGPVNSETSTWIGLGGDPHYGWDWTLFQDGLGQFVTDSGVKNDLWYEYVSRYQGSIYAQTLTTDVSPGQTIYAQVQYYGDGKYYWFIEDEATGQAFHKMTQPGWIFNTNTSADFIEENPNSAGQPLANFNSVTFTDCYANQDNQRASGGSWPFIKDEMSSNTGSAIPQNWNDNNTSFSIIWSDPT